MKILQAKKEKGGSWIFQTEKTELKNPLVLVFGDRYQLEAENSYSEIAK